MRAAFYIGVMLALFGVALVYWQQRVPGAILLCIGIAAAMIGFLGIAVNMAVRERLAAKDRRKG